MLIGCFSPDVVGLSKLREPPPQPCDYEGVLEGDVIGLVRVSRDVVQAPRETEMEEALILEVSVSKRRKKGCINLY